MLILPTHASGMDLTEAGTPQESLPRHGWGPTADPGGGCPSCPLTHTPLSGMDLTEVKTPWEDLPRLPIPFPDSQSFAWQDPVHRVNAQLHFPPAQGHKASHPIIVTLTRKGGGLPSHPGPAATS